MTAEKLLTVDDVSRVLSLPPRVVRKLIRERRLGCIELPGGRVRVESVALTEFIEGCRNGDGSPG